VRIRPVNLVATLIAVVAGLATLLGYFAGGGLLADVRLLLLSVVSLLAAWAVLAGTLNLLLVHAKKFTNQSPGWQYSILVLVGFLAVLLANVGAELLLPSRGAANAANSWFFTYVISTGGAALAGLIAFFLVFAAYRLLHTRRSPLTVIFVISAVLGLVALAPWPSFMPNPQLVGGASLHDVVSAVTRVPAVAGARGLLLGVALGAIATGARVLLGLERPYGD
jgi:hypothetical protein